MPDVKHHVLGVATLADGSHVITTAPLSNENDIRAYEIDPGEAPACGSVVVRVYDPQSRNMKLVRTR
jgi:hypothetical protein